MCTLPLLPEQLFWTHAHDATRINLMVFCIREGKKKSHEQGKAEPISKEKNEKKITN